MLVIPSQNVFPSTIEPILITSSENMDEVILDGKWTSKSEWKYSSLNQFSYDGMGITLRSAHQENFMYFYVDALNDNTINNGIDQATICLDGQNEKNIISDKNDYCFSATLGNQQGIVFQGNSTTGKFEKFQILKTL